MTWREDQKSDPLIPECLPAPGGSRGHSQLEGRLKRYGTAKNRNYQMAGFLLQDQDDRPLISRRYYKRLSDRLYACGAYLRFRQWIDHGDRLTLHAARFCKVPLLCPLCAIRRGGKMLRRYVERADFIARDHDLWMVTLTVANGADLRERFEHLRSSLRKLRKRAQKGSGVFASAAGAVWSFELTRGKDDLWHPHVHMVWAVPKGSPPIRWGEGSQLRDDWHSVTGDSYITHAVKIEAGSSETLLDAFCEVFKYALKFSSLSLSDNLEAFSALSGQRLIASSGVWYGLQLPESADLADDPFDGPYIEHVYRWAGAHGYVPDGGGLIEPDVSSTLSPRRTHEDPENLPFLRRREPAQAVCASEDHADARHAREPCSCC